jgi:DNA-binding IclR family transcriptional regulator
LILLSIFVNAKIRSFNEINGLAFESDRLLAYVTIGRLPIRQVALNYMRRLTDASNETSLLGLYDSMRQEMMFLAMIDSSHPLRYSVELNKWLPVYVGASGLAIMAFLSDAEILMIINRTRLAPVTSRSITERFRLEAELRRFRERGYAITRGQRIPGAVGIAAPVFGSSREVIADICLAIPEIRFDPNSESRISELLKECAGQVTKAIGGQVRKSLAASASSG